MNAQQYAGIGSMFAVMSCNYLLDDAFNERRVAQLRLYGGAIVIRTYGTHKNPYVYLLLPTIFIWSYLL